MISSYMDVTPVIRPNCPPAERAAIVQAHEVKTRLSNGKSVSDVEVLQAMSELYRQDPQSMVPLLPLLALNGKPFSIHEHFPFEPFYKVRIPKKTVWKCGRQVSKSTSFAGSGILRCASNPYLKMLFVTPRFEQIRRFSTNYVRPFINGSPLLRRLLIDETCTQGVLQRSYKNGALQHYSFAFLDVDRVRGISCGFTGIDEVQDMDYDFIPIITECMSACPEPVSIYSGTPKTLDNGIEALWQESSKAEWVIPCYCCGYWNMACAEADLMKMIGLKTVVCAKCDNPVNPAMGRWYHRDPDNTDFHGYHVPQIIMPMHYADPKGEKWGELINKREGKGGYSKQKFLNEVLGESADVGVKLITKTDIQQASKLGRNDFRTAVDKFRRCDFRVLGVDWGGGGEAETSFTAIALVGLDRKTGRVECHYAERFHLGMTHDEEASKLLMLFKECNCHLFCHDYGGSGSVRETLMIQAGLPVDKIMGIMYMRAVARDIMTYKPPPQGEMRGHWILDKARSLVLQAVSLKGGAILLPEYESSKYVTHDLLALMEDKHESPTSADVYLIRRAPKLPDDFSHALNFGSFGIWHSQGAYPDLSLLKKIKLSEKQLDFASPANPRY